MKSQIVFVLDRSGSMGQHIEETISGFNEYLDSISKEKGVRFSLITFSTSVDPIMKSRRVKNVERLSEYNYRPSGLTALYDAIGKAIETLETKSKKSRKIVVIQTDGYENNSSDFTQENIKNLIEMKTKDGWGFVFLGADINAEQESSAIGITKVNTLQYSKVNSKSAFRTLSTATSAYLQSPEKSNFFD